jgi:hypothetical protein
MMHKPATSQEIVRLGDPYRGDVEIRVHGVSGTPPEELLDLETLFHAVCFTEPSVTP